MTDVQQFSDHQCNIDMLNLIVDVCFMDFS